jgi:hypothetical protein
VDDAVAGTPPAVGVTRKETLTWNVVTPLE